ncbi:MAG: ABC transporter ATP-binding protein [Deltaproteobacteria bacterium]
MASAPLLEVEGLCVDIPRSGAPALRAVDDLALCIPEGGSLGLVGESGSGKSLTVLALLGLLPVGARRAVARLSFRGEALGGASEARLRRLRGREIGLVLQDPAAALDPIWRVGDLVAEPLRAQQGLSRTAAAARAVELLREVGIPAPEERARRYPHELSGGMRQRVLLASALAGDPELLIADEPTTALDVTLQAQILSLLARERRQRGMGLLLVSHDLAVVAQICDEVAVLRRGRIVELGPTREIFGAPKQPYTQALLAAARRLEGAAQPIGAA